MIDPSIIDQRIIEARSRDVVTSQRVLTECMRLVVIDQSKGYDRSLDLNTIAQTLRPARYVESGNMNPNSPTYPPVPDNGSYAYQLYSAIMFAIDARAELKLLELIASKDFYAALMRSAAEQAERP